MSRVARRRWCSEVSGDVLQVLTERPQHVGVDIVRRTTLAAWRDVLPVWRVASTISLIGQCDGHPRRPVACDETCGRSGATQLLILSQVVLSLQLPFAVYPLVRLTSRKASMGRFASGPLTAAVAWTMTAGLIGLNGVLLLGMMT